MAAFEYLALDAAGRSKKGILTGDSPRQVRSQLRDQGFFPIEINSVEDIAGRVGKFSIFKRISAANLALITRQLATLLRAGIPLDESLHVIGKQLANRRLLSVLAGVRSQIMEGVSLHEALARYPWIFPELYRVMVEAGENSGRIEEVLDRLADYTESRQVMRQKLSMALIYPAMVTIVAVLVVIVLLTYVVPDVIRVFEQSGQRLPLLTVWLINSSEFIHDYGAYLLVCFIGLVVMWFWLLKKTWIRFYWHQLLLSLPVIGRINRTIDVARLSRTLAILTNSGVPLLDALAIGGRMVRNLPLRRVIEEAADSVREGGRLHLALNKMDYFPPILVHLLAVGEDSGELENMLARIASHQELELETTVTAVTTLLEPVIILFMGIFVLFIVLAILLPIFEMNRLIGI